jgi:uncharacterized protein (TIGR03545 family)
MSKWIRWRGVIVFLVVVLLVAAVWLLVVDRVIRRVIEKSGTVLVGAKVELGEADLSLFPLGLTLSRLQVTNPDQPMTNAVEIARIAFSMDSLNLLRRKVIIEEATVEGVRLNTPRTTSGALASRPAEPVSKKAGGDLFSLPSFSATDVQEILSKEELRSQALVESLRTDLQVEQEQWQKRLAALPDKAKLDSYRKRLEGLKSAGKGGLGGVVGGAGEALAIQQDLSRDLDQIKSARNSFEDHVAGLRKRMDEAVRAPQEDARRLMEKYSLSGSGLANVTGMLIGGTIGDWTATSLRWYTKLQPLLQRKAERKRDVEVVKPVRGKGVDVRFKERAPLPDLLIRTTHVSVELPAGAITGQVRNITPDQPILGIPLTFEFTGDKLKGLQSVKLDGTLSRVDPARPSDRANLRMRGYRIEDLSLSKSEQWALALKQAVADTDLQATLSGEALNADLAATLQSVQLASGVKAGAGVLANAVASALSDVKGFTLKAEVTGTVEQYDVKVESDLDQVLKDVVGKQVQAQTARLETELQSAIAEKVAGPLNELKASLGGLDNIGTELASRLNLGSELLKGAKGGSPGGFKLPF